MAKKLAALGIFVGVALAAIYLIQPPKPSIYTPGTQRLRTMLEGSTEFRPRTVIGQAFAPIVKVPFEDAEKGSETVGDAMLVLGVSFHGIAKAYPISMLCGPSREIINDTFGEHPLAATW